MTTIAAPDTWREEGALVIPGRVLELQLTRDDENIDPGNGILD